MKKMIFLLTLIFLGSTTLFSLDRLMISVGGNYFAPSDEGYKTIYGKTQFCPDFKATVRVYNRFFIGIGYGICVAKGTIPPSNDPTESRLDFLSISAGYRAPLVGKLIFRIELGGENVSYKEKAWGEEKSGSSSALRIGGGIDIPVSKILFGALSFSYANPESTIDEETIKLGGFKAGVSLGMKF